MVPTFCMYPINIPMPLRILLTPQHGEGGRIWDSSNVFAPTVAIRVQCSKSTPEFITNMDTTYKPHYSLSFSLMKLKLVSNLLHK